MKRKKNIFSLTRWPLLIAGLTATVGIFISIYLYTRISQTETTEARLSAQILEQSTKHELTQFISVIESVCALHALSDDVNQAAMNEFISKGMIHQLTVLGTFGLAQRIPNSIRKEIENRGRDQPGAYTIVQFAKDGTCVPAEQKPIYYPLTWQISPEALNIPVGFDFSSVPEARESIKEMEQTRRTRLVPKNIPFSDQKSYWVFAPVIPKQLQQPPYLITPVIGFAVAELKPDRIIENIRNRTPGSPDLSLTLVNLNDSVTTKNIQLQDNAWKYSHPFEMLGTRWVFKCSLPAKTAHRRSAIVLLFGLSITALITTLLFLVSDRARKIKKEVQMRTEELYEANTHLGESLQERAHLEEQIHEQAALERQRIGRDLHDSLGQKLTGSVFLSRSLLNHMSPDQTELQNQAKTLTDTLKDAVSQVRSMARGLAPVTLNDENFCGSLQQLTEEMNELYTVPCKIGTCTEPPGLSRKTKEQLYMITREAVNNAARHAEPESITIELTVTENTWKLCVKDDGKGFNPDRQNGTGMGTRIMRHRAGLINAELTIRSRHDTGTCVEVKGNLQIKPVRSED